MKKLFQILLVLTCMQSFGQVIITGGQTLAGNTDQQQLSLAGDTLSLENGGSVVLDGLTAGSTYEAKTQIQFNALTAPEKAAYTGVIVDTDGNVISAVNISIEDVGGYFPTKNVEAALQQLASDGGGSILPVIDNTSLLEGSIDPTKEVRIEADTNVPTGTIITITAPSADLNLEVVNIEHPNSPNLVRRWYSGTVEQIATAQGAGQLIAGDIALPTNAQPARTGTGTAIEMNGFWQYNFQAASAAATFTMTNILDGGYAEVLVNNATEPVVTGAVKRPNTATFIASTNMILHIKDYDGTRKFWFTEFIMWWIILFGFKRKKAGK